MSANDDPPSSTEERLRGVVKWFNPTKGFGFIVPDGDEHKADLFVHSQEIEGKQRTLAEGEEVEFTIVFEDGKRKACRVTGPLGASVKGAPKLTQEKQAKERAEKKRKRTAQKNAFRKNKIRAEKAAVVHITLVKHEVGDSHDDHMAQQLKGTGMLKPL